MAVTPRVAAVVLVLAGGAAEAGPPSPPRLDTRHEHPSGAFHFSTPSGWTVEASPTDPGALQARSDTLLVRFVYRAQEAGYDSLHVTCMLERLAPPMATEPRVRYEYDFLGGSFGSRRALDSAFFVRYDAPVLGHRDWRQRNVTVVGEGESLCLIAYAPAEIWKKSEVSRAVLDAILESVTFREGS